MLSIPGTSAGGPYGNWGNIWVGNTNPTAQGECVKWGKTQVPLLPAAAAAAGIKSTSEWHDSIFWRLHSVIRTSLGVCLP